MQPHPVPNALPPALHWLAFSAFWAVVIYFAWFQLTHAVNIPHQDGIYDFLQFVINVEQAESLRAALAEWFSHYNDHRTNASRIQVYLAYLVEGEVNFHTLTLLANLSLVLILGIVYLAVREHPHRWLFLAASAALLLHIRVFEIILWSQPVYAYCYVFVYAFGCLFALHEATPGRVIAAAILCTLASWTFAAAQALWLLGLVSLIQQALFHDRRAWRYAILWTLIAAAMLALWQQGHKAIEMADFSAQDPELLARMFPGLLIDPTWQEAAKRFAAFFLVMLGSAFTPDNPLLAGVIGAGMLLALVGVSLASLRDRDLRLALCCWFVVGSAAAVTYGRALIAVPAYSLDSRYSFLSVLLASTLLVLLLKRLNFRSPWPAGVLATLAVFYCVWVYQRFAEPLDALMQARYDDFNKGHYIVFGYPLKASNAVVEEAIRLGIYSPPCRPQPECGSARAAARQD